ncbi:hypothetical protein [Blautia sp. MSJ-36]|uniref:hypothetical protein n=1 Tax=Blautia sp. MSJ-36 TaxID=2841530 RepID=UPI001C11A67F|nr:hypothetical protein [Blautia sp. MSJ-36]MBU5446318.1 hypothetical protein [Blautia sp. MSJ-36]
MGKDVEFWSTDDMYKYSLKAYPSLITDKDNPIFRNTEEQRIKKQINRVLENLGFEFIKITDDSQEEQAQSDTTTKRYHVPSDYARYIIKVNMYDYFMRYNPNKINKQQQIEEKHQMKVLSDIATRSLEEDRKLTNDTGVSHIMSTLYEEIENNPNYDPEGKLRKALDESPWTKQNLHQLSNNESINKKAFEFHIPSVPLNELTTEMVDKIVDRAMLRAIFNKFFDFDEKAYRHAIYESAAHIKEKDEDGVTPIEGYSGLTKQIENPLGIFITPKKGKI